ncbi:class A beta-lactamase [Rhizobium sp. ARZ01]|uniref:class A beta-lactamase n=1 Tax=Rhizobium sp. ARZ01 TaxID=2769313 RepID=UPI001786F30F|nr:class A beta-lactamase [Rhizobium sp. ARZ01]MBD9373576.1 class A beta-lactamase [Rhizobium sp. ARZ01]
MRRPTLVVAACVVALATFASLPALGGENPILGAAKKAETSLGARVGLAVVDTATGNTWLHNADQRFPMASTFKALACAALLDSGTDKLERKVVIGKADLESYSPVTKSMVGRKASASDLCEITLRTSDNTAANKVLEVLGGPAAVTAFLRSVGDDTSRLDRTEPKLNEGKPDDPRDTTTPTKMAETMRKLVLGDALGEPERRQLTDWLVGNEVAGPLLRAGIPGDWRIADRTGAGGHGTRGIVAVMWPPERKPIVAAIYLTETDASMDARNAAIAEIGKAIAAEFTD